MHVAVCFAVLVSACLGSTIARSLHEERLLNELEDLLAKRGGPAHLQYNAKREESGDDTVDALVEEPSKRRKKGPSKPPKRHRRAELGDDTVDALVEEPSKIGKRRKGPKPNKGKREELEDDTRVALVEELSKLSKRKKGPKPDKGKREEVGDDTSETSEDASGEGSKQEPGESSAKETDSTEDQADDSQTSTFHMFLGEMFRLEMQILMGQCTIYEWKLQNIDGEKRNTGLEEACAEYIPKYIEYENLGEKEKQSADNDAMKHGGQWDITTILCKVLTITDMGMEHYILNEKNSHYAKHLPKYSRMCKFWNTMAKASNDEVKEHEEKADKTAEADEKNGSAGTLRKRW